MNIFESSNLLKGHARHSKATASRVRRAWRQSAPVPVASPISDQVLRACVKGKKWLTALRKNI